MTDHPHHSERPDRTPEGDGPEEDDQPPAVEPVERQQVSGRRPAAGAR